MKTELYNLADKFESNLLSDQLTESSAVFTHYIDNIDHEAGKYYKETAYDVIWTYLNKELPKNEITPKVIEDFISIYIEHFKVNSVIPKGDNIYSFIDLFAGIGGFRISLQKSGGQCVFSSEWDRFSKRTYYKNYGEVPFGDITKIDESNIPPHDILAGGFPCQPFSLAGVSKKNSLGRKHGFMDETQGTLFFDIARIIKERRPKAIILENVKNLKSHDKGKTMKVIQKALEEDLNYKIFIKVIDAKYYVPQHRERVFIVGFDQEQIDTSDEFQFPEHKESDTVTLKESNVLQKKVDKKYILSDKLWNYLKEYAEKHRRKGNGFGFGLADPNSVTRTLSARYHKDGAEILISRGKGKNPRRLTPQECKGLMGYPEEFRITNTGVSDTQLYRQFGNSVAVPVVEDIAERVKNYMLRNRKITYAEPERASTCKVESTEGVTA
ncbi:DNA (cytosine-5-)-methyltransferase [Salinimicrobium sediminilitoris]|uniref:DNA (cytosine-5-)-methyltransferase n=1 Tax=Salinimicrobium sediminilitoris TaxID=2876715 RepID=UPI001E2C4CBC|nr:DNA (cytosine-5-)-methyltransferase [Salinimicrobium sediminilitoris]MCC8361014.1 DNA (cytosine-5-)-methyltransferase [Salinimicrobium sediminilitoris]